MFPSGIIRRFPNFTTPAETVATQLLHSLYTAEMKRRLNSVSHLKIKTPKRTNCNSVRRSHNGEIWCLVLMKAHSHRMFENKELGKILGLKREEVIGAWIKINKQIKLRNEKRHV
jgi:hypothetical protein